MNKNTNVQNYIDLQNKFNRMKKLIDHWQIEYAIEKFKPAIDDGFEAQDIVEYFTVNLVDYLENKYEPTKIEEDGGK
jgi:hypothetical protein